MSTVNPSFKPSEVKREEFRKYLEKNGVMDALTRVLVNLYEEVEKPDDALEYIRDKLAVMAGLEPGKQLQIKLADAEEQIKELEAKISGESGKSEPEAAPVGSNSELPLTNEDQIKAEEEVPQEKTEKSEEP